MSVYKVLTLSIVCVSPGWPYLTDLLREGSATTITNQQCRRDVNADDPLWLDYISNATVCIAGRDYDETRPSWVSDIEI